MTKFIFAAALAPTLFFGFGARADMPADCTTADTIVGQKISLLLHRDDVRSRWLAGNSVSSIEKARAMCHGEDAGEALRLYGELLLYIEIQDAALRAGFDPSLVEALPPARASGPDEEPGQNPW